MSRVRVAVTLLLIAMSVTAQAALSDFQGRWRNADAKSRSLTTLELSTENGRTTLHAWGSCAPTDCDLGEWPAVAYSPSIAGPLVTKAEVLIVAVGKTTILVISKGRTDGTLKCDVFRQFDDGSSRSNYMESVEFKRSPIQPRRK